LNIRDELAKAKHTYDINQSQINQYYKNFELAQQWAGSAQKESLQTKKQLEELTNSSSSHAAGHVAAQNSGQTRNRITAIPFIPQPEPAGLEPLRRQAPMAVVTAIPAEAWEKEESRLGKYAKNIWQYAKILIISLVLALCMRLFVFNVAVVDGVSMIPTLQPADSLIISRIAYKLHDPQRYDIILLEAPGQLGFLIKRIIGLPNEHIEIKEGQVFINDELLNEEYLDNIYTATDISEVIPDDYYFVMGDNRPDSRDSRSDSVGLIAKDKIGGKAVLRFFPLEDVKFLY
jgi:signal peptidase I